VVCTRFSSKTDSHLIADCSPSKCSGGGFNDGRYVKRPVYGALLTFGPDCGSTRIWHCVPIRSAKFGDRNLPIAAVHPSSKQLRHAHQKHPKNPRYF
jgi:hypothetical protein